MKKTLKYILMMMVLVACEPLAPESGNQAVIVITNTFTPAPQTSATPVLPTPLPTRILPTATATVYIPPSPTIPSCEETEGRLQDGVFQSEIRGELIEFRLYLPPCFYRSGRRYPYVILLHGSGFDFTQWTDGVRIHEVMNTATAEKSPTVAPMVLVMPNGGESQELNLFEVGRSFEDIILGELIPTLERDFCIWNAPAGRAIGGISRGGFWAMSIALRHPDLFASVGGHSPFFVEDNAPADHNPLNLASSLPLNSTLRIYLDNAGNDSGSENVIRFSNLLQGRNINHVYEVSATGGHDNDYWASQARDYVEFYSGAWPKSAADLPSCF